MKSPTVAGEQQAPLNRIAVRLAGDAKGPVKSRAILITGVARGGTSFAASICFHLGLDLGRGGPRYENPFLQRAVLKEDWEAVEKISRAISDHTPLWGWKLPAIIQHLKQIDRVVDNTSYIFVIRNPLETIPRRTAIESNDIVGQTISRVSNNYIRAGMFARMTKSPCLFLNFERATANSEQAVIKIAEFCGVDVKNPADVVRQVALDGQAYTAGRGEGANNRVGLIYDPAHELYRKIRKIAKHHGIDRPLGVPKPGKAKQAESSDL